MTKFFLKELSLTGKGVETSSIEFTSGVNVIYGDSNTGKSYILDCLNFMFGLEKDKFRIGKDTGYDTVHLHIETANGTVFLERKFDENIFLVKSTDKKIKQGTYRLEKEYLNIDNLWLTLMGIDNPPKVIATQALSRNNLTFRSFLHTFFISETNILKLDSILLPEKSYKPSYNISVLLYLITGNSFENLGEAENKNIKEAKKVAVVDYIQSSIRGLSTRKSNLDCCDLMPLDDIQAHINSTLEEISVAEGTLSTALARSKSLSKEIYTLNEKLVECHMLKTKYDSLVTLYDGDIDRITFMLEGERESHNSTLELTCPLCNCTQENKAELLPVDSMLNELETIVFKVNELRELNREIATEMVDYYKKVEILTSERKKVETIINSELNPKIEKLKEDLKYYRLSIEVQKEASVLTNLEASMVKDIETIITPNEETIPKFKPKEQFKGDITTAINDTLSSLLKECNFEGLKSCNFNLSSFDVVVNNKAKRTFGKGYRAFLNTILALTLRSYLETYGKFSPGMLIIDSPILSLKEQGDEKAPDTMKASLFNFLVSNSNSTQTIIIENDIPSIDYKDTNLICFTKDSKSGRYGFLKNIK